MSRKNQSKSSVLGDLLTAREVAELLGISIPTLARWRQTGAGPRFLKLGGRRENIVRYRQADIAAFLDQAERRSTSDPGLRVA